MLAALPQPKTAGFSLNQRTCRSSAFSVSELLTLSWINDHRGKRAAGGFSSDASYFLSDASYLPRQKTVMKPKLSPNAQ